MANSLQSYLGHLWEINRTDFNRLSAEDLESMTALLIKETPTKYLPFIEEKDHGREVLFMLREWIETEDEGLGYDILSKMKNLVVDAMSYKIEEEMLDYEKREEIARKETRDHERQEGYVFDKQRI